MKSVQRLESNKELNIFKLLRTLRNITVRQLSEALSVSPAYINAIEKGDRFPGDRLLRDYAIALGVDETVIRSFKPHEYTNKSFEYVLLTLLKMICEMDDK